MQKAGPGAASQLPSSFPHPAHRVDRLEGSCATAPHGSAAEAGMLKDVTKAPLYLSPSALLHRKSTCVHTHRLKTTQTCNSVRRDPETGLSGGRLAELETHKAPLAVTAAAGELKMWSGSFHLLLESCLVSADRERPCTKTGVCGLCRTAVWHCSAEVRVCSIDVSKMWYALERERRIVVTL